MARTLADILNTMPDAGWQRFSTAFWVAKANFVLNEIETALSGPPLNTEVAVQLVGGVTMYQIPDIIRKAERIRFPSDGYLGRIDEDPATKTRYQILGRQFRLREVPVLSSTPDRTITQNLSDVTEAILQYTRIRDPNLKTAGWQESHVGRAVICDHGNGDVESLIAAGVGADSSSSTIYLQLNGKLNNRVVANQTAVITSNFVIIEGSRRLKPFASLNDYSPIPSEWDRVLAKGLRFYLEVQQDEGGANAGTAREWYTLFTDDMDAIQADYNNLDGDNYPIRPRSPVMFNAIRRNRQ